MGADHCGTFFIMHQLNFPLDLVSIRKLLSLRKISHEIARSKDVNSKLLMLPYNCAPPQKCQNYKIQMSILHVACDSRRMDGSVCFLKVNNNLMWEAPWNLGCLGVFVRLFDALLAFKKSRGVAPKSFGHIFNFCLSFDHFLLSSLLSINDRHLQLMCTKQPRSTSPIEDFSSPGKIKWRGKYCLQSVLSNRSFHHIIYI